MKKYLLFFLIYTFSTLTFSQIPVVTRWVGPTPRKRITPPAYKKGLDLTEIYKSSNFDSHSRRILIIFEENLYEKLKSTYTDDFFNEIENSSYSIDVYEYHSGTPEELKGFFKNFYNSANSLDGVILIGDLPYAIYERNDDWGNKSKGYTDFPCDLFYMDMTGTWEDDGGCDGCEADNGKYDGVNDSGNEFLEIWVSRIFPGHIESEDEYVTLINNFLEKDAMFRRKKTLTYDSGLVYDDDDWENFTSWDKNNLSKLIPSENIVAPEEDSHGDVCTASDYKTNRMPQNYQLIYLRSHGYPGGHGFYENDKNDFNYVFIPDYLSKVGDGTFYFLFVCSGCDFSSTENTYGFLGGRVLFSDHGGLISIGSTKTGGMWDDAYFFDKLSDRSNFGESFSFWLNNALIDYPDIGPQWWYGMVIIGDGSLYFNPHRLGDLNFDGKIDAVDLELFYQYLVSNIGEEDIDLPSCDLNKDGNITITDLLKLMEELSQ